MHKTPTSETRKVACLASRLNNAPNLSQSKQAFQQTQHGRFNQPQQTWGKGHKNEGIRLTCTRAQRAQRAPGAAP